jgi:hypothetical protein
MAELSNRKAASLLALAAALFLLNASLTFRNLWPTPAITWTGDLSVELAACVLGLALFSRAASSRASSVTGWLAAAWVFLVVGRYADVTAPALYGRPINLYWDGRRLSAVAAMLARPAAWWIVIVVVAAAILIPLLLHRVFRWALARVLGAMRDPLTRRVLGASAAIVVVCFAARRVLPAPTFTTPVTATYAHQARLLAAELTSRGRRTVGPSPVFESDFGRIRGADVLLIFVESYGAVSYDRPEFARALAEPRRQLEADIRDTGRRVVSAFVQSPTFGGNSWLAHISFLSGLEVRDEDTSVVLMTEKRDTFVTAFARRGYRTVAIMPGLQEDWPEGAFYGFTDIYGEQRLDYRGQSFGWWSIPDQFSIARLDAQELARHDRAPVLAFFPTTSTHTPFSPTAPYQPAWARMLTDEPYDDLEYKRAWLDTPDWMDLGPSYVHALAYALRCFGGYLRLRADRHLVMILIGDHQPPAVVSGEGARWDVPIHVIASDAAALEPLIARGFGPGLTPAPEAIAPMHTIGPALLEAFASDMK